MIDVKFIGRKAYPSRIPIGVMKDNEIEALRFSLPDIGEAQASFLYVWINDEYADVARPLADGVYDVTSLLTQKGAEMDAFIEIRSGDKLWHSESFVLVVEDLPAIGQQIEKQYPTALEQALDEAEAYLAKVRAAAKEIKELKAKARTLYPGQPATAEYDVTTGTITIGVPQGIKGNKGDPGKDGRAGEQGPRGEKGETGPQGPKGDTGAQGPKGERGLAGEKGDRGERGPMGIQGLQGPQGIQGPKGDTYDDIEVRADISELKGDLSGIAVFKRINLNDENLATDGYFYNPSGVPQRNSFYSYSDFIPVKKGDTVRCLADTTINNKAITFFDKNKTFLFQTTNSSGERPSTRAVWKYLDSGTKIIYTISYTLNEEAAYVRYSYATETKGIADMFTVNTEMPIDYIPYSSKNVSIEEKVKIPSADQIEDFEEKVKKVKKVSNLKGLKIGFLGDSFTDVTNYYGAMIAERTGIISYNYGKQGSRIYADNTVFGNIVQPFWKRALNMENELDCIVVFGGINDGSSRTIYETNLGTIDDTASTREQIEAGGTPTTFYAACKTVCELLMDKYPEKKVLMVIPPHVLNSDYGISLKAYMGIEKIIEAERNVADFYGIPVCDLWKNCTEMNNFQGNVAIYRIGSSNDIHPNTKGQYAMSVLIQKSLENLFD